MDYISACKNFVVQRGITQCSPNTTEPLTRAAVDYPYAIQLPGADLRVTRDVGSD